MIDRAIQVHGARGLTDETPLAHMAMMARGGRIYDGPDEVHRHVVANASCRAFTDGDGWNFHVGATSLQGQACSFRPRRCTIRTSARRSS